jgi:hypothetical protein
MTRSADLPLPSHPPSYWLRLFSSQTFSLINTRTFSLLVILHTYPPKKVEQTECCETSAYKIQTLENYPEESIQEPRVVTSLANQAVPELWRHSPNSDLGCDIADRLYHNRGNLGTLSCVIDHKGGFIINIANQLWPIHSVTPMIVILLLIPNVWKHFSWVFLNSFLQYHFSN